MYRGDYFPIRIYVVSSTGAAVDLTGSTVKSQMRRVGAAGLTYDFTATITNAVGGVVDLLLPSSVSETLEPGDYIWDFQITNPAGNTRTYFAADVKVYDQVTV